MVSADDGGKGRFCDSDEKKDKLQFKLWRRGNKQLAVGDEFDDALVAGLVRILVDTMMECRRTGEKLERQIQSEHQTAGEELSPRS